MFSQRGEVCNLVPGNQIASLGFSHWNIRKGFHMEFHQISKLWDSQPLAAKPTAKYRIRVVFSIKLLLKLIWLKVSLAFNLGQRQQWNFPSLSCGAWHQHISGSFQQRSSHFTPTALVGWNWLKPEGTGLIEFKCTWYKRESRSLARTSALDFNKEGCVIQIRVD